MGGVFGTFRGFEKVHAVPDLACRLGKGHQEESPGLPGYYLVTRLIAGLIHSLVGELLQVK